MTKIWPKSIQDTSIYCQNISIIIILKNWFYRPIVTNVTKLKPENSVTNVTKPFSSISHAKKRPCIFTGPYTHYLSSKKVAVMVDFSLVLVSSLGSIRCRLSPLPWPLHSWSSEHIPLKLYPYCYALPVWQPSKEESDYIEAMTHRYAVADEPTFPGDCALL